jgi:hypothetical protein
MRFTFEVELDDALPDETVLDELGRALRYWAGNLKHYPLTDGQHDTVRDSAYAEVGEWRLERGSASQTGAAEVAGTSHAADDHPSEASGPS